MNTQQSPLIALSRKGKINPESPEDFLQNGGFKGLQMALKQDPDTLVELFINSGLRGRGGAGFPTGRKQKFTAATPAEPRYVVCNADEGEPGTFKDKCIMESDPFALIEGMLIAGYATGASHGFIYIRGEYKKSIALLENAVKKSTEAGYLGKNILNSAFSFSIEIFPGAGSYLCGEELTLLESLEGKRGYPRIKPPFPAERGLWGKPTLVNNVETLVHLPFILTEGVGTYKSIGTEGSPGTKLFCVSGNVNKPGVYELPMGVTLRALLDTHAGGMKARYHFKGALLGGAAGTFVDASALDTPLAFETLRHIGATLGSGAVIVIDDTSDLKSLMSSVLDFFKHESCGKCVPCRIGTTLLSKLWNEAAEDSTDYKSILQHARYMASTSLCPLGQSPVLPLESYVKYFSSKI